MDLIVKPTELCNFKCSFCSSSKITFEDNTATLDLNKIFKFLKRFPETQTIIVNGGDPLMMRPNYYWKIIEYLDKHDLPASISLTTNLYPFLMKPMKWKELFNHPRVEENEDTHIKTVELAKKMDVVCKVNYAMASGSQSAPYQLSKIYEKYVEIWKAGLSDWEHNTQQMMVRLRGESTICPQTRTCDSGIRTLQPEGDYYSCGAFGDDLDKAIDFDYEMSGGFSTPLATDLSLMSLKNACYTCPMFEICNGCKKTVKDLKQHNMVEDHCKHMKTLAADIISINSINRQLTPYEREYA